MVVVPSAKMREEPGQGIGLANGRVGVIVEASTIIVALMLLCSKPLIKPFRSPHGNSVRPILPDSTVTDVAAAARTIYCIQLLCI